MGPVDIVRYVPRMWEKQVSKFQGKEYVRGYGCLGLWESWAWDSQHRGWDSPGRAGLRAGVRQCEGEEEDSVNSRGRKTTRVGF